jgi:hypothetical protein
VLVPVGEGVQDLASDLDEESEARRVAAEAKKLPDDDDDDDDDGGDDETSGDTRLGGVDEGEEEKKREARREERRSRKARQKANRERSERELRFLAARNEQLERQISSIGKRLDRTDENSDVQRLNQLKSALRDADRILADAVDAKSGKEVAEATGIRDQIRDQIRKTEDVIVERKRRLSGEGGDGKTSTSERSGERGDPSRTSARIDPRTENNVRSWASKNTWFKFDRSDQDSAIAGAIDDSLFNEGYDPATSEYFAELDRRISKVLPHRSPKRRVGGGNGADEGDAGVGDRSPEKRRNAPKFRVGGQERSLKKNEVYISAERRKAMEEAGVWEDPVLRTKYLRRYAEYDRAHAND